MCVFLCVCVLVCMGEHVTLCVCVCTCVYGWARDSVCVCACRAAVFVPGDQVWGPCASSTWARVCLQPSLPSQAVWSRILPSETPRRSRRMWLTRQWGCWWKLTPRLPCPARLLGARLPIFPGQEQTKRLEESAVRLGSSLWLWNHRFSTLDQLPRPCSAKFSD